LASIISSWTAKVMTLCRRPPIKAALAAERRRSVTSDRMKV